MQQLPIYAPYQTSGPPQGGSDYSKYYPAGPLQQTPPPRENFNLLFSPIRDNPHQSAPVNSAMPLTHSQAPHPDRNPDTPFQLAVEGRDDRFENNNYYSYRQSTTNPNQHYDFAEPLNIDSGLTFMPMDARTGTYKEDRPFSWDDGYISDNVSQETRMIRPGRFDDGKDVTPYRSRSTLGIDDQMYNPNGNGSGDGYRSLADLPGNNQYYYNNLDPMEGIFISSHKVDHRDLLYPNGMVIPHYETDVNVEDYIEQVRDRQLADELYYRENFDQNIRNKMNEREYQYRLAPTVFNRRLK
jgi:hypothetical protein